MDKDKAMELIVQLENHVENSNASYSQIAVIGTVIDELKEVINPNPTLRDTALALIKQSGSRDKAIASILYHKSKLTTDHMFKYITDKELEIKLEYLEGVLKEIY